MFDGGFKCTGVRHWGSFARLYFDCTNNIAEYKASILGLEAAIDLRIKHLEVFGDSALVVYQVNSEWDTKHPKLIPYWDHILKLDT